MYWVVFISKRTEGKGQTLAVVAVVAFLRVDVGRGPAACIVMLVGDARETSTDLNQKELESVGTMCWALDCSLNLCARELQKQRKEKGTSVQTLVESPLNNDIAGPQSTCHFVKHDGVP